MLWWNESLETGIEIINMQHKSLFSKANEILSLEITDEDKIKEKFEFLIRYAKSHFAEEERLMFDTVS